MSDNVRRQRREQQPNELRKGCIVLMRRSHTRASPLAKIANFCMALVLRFLAEISFWPLRHERVYAGPYLYRSR